MRETHNNLRPTLSRPETRKAKTTENLVWTGFDLSGREWWYALVMTLGFIGYISRFEGGYPFAVMTTTLTVFIGFEIFNRVKLNPYSWLLEPTVWASLFTFVLVYGVTNFAYFLPEEQLALTGLVPAVTPAMNKLMSLVLIAASAMWWGFYLPFGGYLGQLIGTLFKPLLRKTLDVSLPAIFGFVILSGFARYQQVSLGVFGYASDYQALLKYGAVREYLDIAAGFGTLALLAVSLAYFHSGRRALLTMVLVLVTYEVVIAFLSGFKGRVLLPFVVVGGASLVVRGQFPRLLIPILVAALLLAYAVVEPFRDIKHSASGIDATNIGSIATAINEAASGAISNDKAETTSMWVPILARTNITSIASLGISYIDENGDLPEDSPSFLADIFLAPLHAVIPRLIWTSKPTQSLGLWYVTEVMSLNITTSVGMGPITYLYFAGGVVAVLIGFAVVGIIQRALFVGLFNAGGGGIICYLMLLPTMVLIDSSFNTFFSAIVRYSLVFVVGQWILLRR